MKINLDFFIKFYFCIMALMMLIFSFIALCYPSHRIPVPENQTQCSVQGSSCP